jgi:hypothetical protein
LKSDNNLRTAWRKILADNSAAVVFELLKLIDGNAAPDDEIGPWSGVRLVDLEEDSLEEKELLQDSFFETYKEWKNIRPEKGWELDLVEE